MSEKNFTSANAAKSDWNILGSHICKARGIDQGTTSGSKPDPVFNGEDAQTNIPGDGQSRSLRGVMS